MHAPTERAPVRERRRRLHVEEQERAFGQFFEAEFGLDEILRTSNQNLQLGVRLRF